MTYPDPDDARNMKAGSDHDRAEAWRIIAQDLRAESGRLAANNAELAEWALIAQGARAEAEAALAEAKTERNIAVGLASCLDQFAHLAPGEVLAFVKEAARHDTEVKP